MNDLPTLADGLFYPGDKDELDALITPLLKEVSITGPGTGKGSLKAVLAPHAAYDYCAVHLAAAYTALKKSQPATRPERIILLCPFHRDSEEGIFLTGTEGINLPCGRIAFDTKAAEALKSQPGFKAWELPYAEEPGMEVQLPFIHKLFPGLPVLPLFGRTEKAASRKNLAAALKKLPGSLLVLSSNLGEFKPREESRKLAEEFVDAATAASPPFHPGEWRKKRKGGLPGPCGIGLLEAVWLFLEKEKPNTRLELTPLSWGPDIPEDPAGKDPKEKAAYYGAFSIIEGERYG